LTELLISLNFETALIEQKSALFVNKHVLSQSNRVDSFINALNSEDLSVSNQNSFESQVVVKFEIIYDFVDALLSAFVSILDIELNAAHQ
jgi:hypothetical protein